MTVSVFDLFKIGIGPSSSHTVGPMIAARQFVCHVRQTQGWDAVHGVRVELFGSLAATGIGHGTDRAILLGLAGHEPDQVEPEHIAPAIDAIRSQQSSESQTRDQGPQGVPGALTNQPPVPATAPVTTPPVAGAPGPGQDITTP